MSWPAYESARYRCSGKAQPGAVALLTWAVRDFGQGARNLGIYNCRSIRGSRNRSIHGDGRALDVGFSGVGNPAGTRLLQTLLPHVGTLGIQMIIWNRRIYSARYPNGAPYRGIAPHTDHVHIELTWAAAKGLTLSRVRQVLSGTPVRYSADLRALAAAITAAKRHTYRLGDRSENVKFIQAGINKIAGRRLSVDGVFGPSTEKAIKDLQRFFGLKVDGVVGPSTWRILYP